MQISKIKNMEIYIYIYTFINDICVNICKTGF